MTVSTPLSPSPPLSRSVPLNGAMIPILMTFPLGATRDSCPQAPTTRSIVPINILPYINCFIQPSGDKGRFVPDDQFVGEISLDFPLEFFHVLAIQLVAHDDLHNNYFFIAQPTQVGTLDNDVLSVD